MRPLPPHTSPDTKGTRNGIFRFATNAAADGHPLAELRPYIDWTYFFHAWGFEPRYASIARADSPESWLAAIPPRQQAKAAEALRLYHDAGLLLDQLAACPTARVESIYRLCTAYSDGDDLLLDGVRLPLLRQQTSRGTTEAPSLCLSDFVRPLSQGIPDVVGVFATAAHMPETDTGTADDPYRHLLVQTLADRLPRPPPSWPTFGYAATRGATLQTNDSTSRPCWQASSKAYGQPWATPRSPTSRSTSSLTACCNSGA